MARRTGCGVWLLFWIIIFLTALILILLNREKFDKYIQNKNFLKSEKTLKKEKKEELKEKKYGEEILKEEKKEEFKGKKNSEEILKEEKKEEFKGKKYKEGILKEDNKYKFTGSYENSKIRIKLYFTKYIENEDKLKLVEVERIIPKTDTPLKDAINYLLKGPTEEEYREGIRSMFPANVKLLDAYVKDGIAYLNFNSAVELGVGVSTINARLYQIVYTATQFESVDKVRILIDGAFKESFSIEGISIRSPLGRLNRTPIF